MSTDFFKDAAVLLVTLAPSINVELGRCFMLPDDVVVGEPTTACPGANPIRLTRTDACVQACATFCPLQEFRPKTLTQQVTFG